jgi:hypothetical protein
MYQPRSDRDFAAIESLMSAVVAAGMIGRKHDSNRNSWRQGLRHREPLLAASGDRRDRRTATNIKTVGYPDRRHRARDRSIVYAFLGGFACIFACRPRRDYRFRRLEYGGISRDQGAVHGSEVGYTVLVATFCSPCSSISPSR